MPDNDPFSRIDLLERATEENFYALGYVFANKDLTLRQSQGEFDEHEHLLRNGIREKRFQIRREFLEDPTGFLRDYRAQKYAQFSRALAPDCSPNSSTDVTFPLSVGRRHFALTEYRAESAHAAPPFFVEALKGHPDDLYVDVGCGFRSSLFPNCLYLEVYPSLSADVVYEAGTPLPFRSASLDGIGCFSVLEHVQKPWVLVDEIWRVLKPGGKIFISYPFLQPFHGYPHHYFNATRQGLRSLFEERFELDRLDTLPSQGADYTLNWVLRGIINSIQDKNMRKRVLRMSIGELLQNRPGKEFYKDILASMDSENREKFACGNTLLATKR